MSAAAAARTRIAEPDAMTTSASGSTDAGIRLKSIDAPMEQKSSGCGACGRGRGQWTEGSQDGGGHGWSRRAAAAAHAGEGAGSGRRAARTEGGVDGAEEQRLRRMRARARAVDEVCVAAGAVVGLGAAEEQRLMRVQFAGAGIVDRS
eukprot:366154-Chlamydomonas_euryale.AAC.11